MSKMGEYFYSLCEQGLIDDEFDECQAMTEQKAEKEMWEEREWERRREENERD